ncbi:PFL family protein [bacterium]|nr:PFL family protein [bacterium]
MNSASPAKLTTNEIFDTLMMFEEQHLDIRTITLGVNLLDCASSSVEKTCQRVIRKLLTVGQKLVPTVSEVARDLGIPIINKRISVTPISLVGAAAGPASFVPLAMALDRAAAELGVDFVAGFSAPVHRGVTRADMALLNSLPEALNRTQRVCSSISLASTRAGINMDAVAHMGRLILEIANQKPELEGLPCCRLVVFCNQPEDNPFVAGAMHGPGEADVVIHVGVSGPGVVKAALEKAPQASLNELADIIKLAAFKITRLGEMAGREVARRLGYPMGIVDLSLAPTPARGDSVGEILQVMGLEYCGVHGSTAALAMLNDAVKKGGAMASSQVGGLSGAFIPLSEDASMADAAKVGALTIDKLEAMTCVCSVGLDMVAVPGDTPAETLAAIIADEMAIGMINGKTTAVRIIPVPGKKAGDYVSFGGLLGAAPIIPVHSFSSAKFIRRGGNIPAPLQSLRN